MRRDKPYDLCIFGAGFGGSLLAMAARRIGLSVLLIERGSHPRFAIGESTSPLTNLILEEIALRYDLPFLAPFTSFGPWQQTYPHITCGLKRGFTYYHHRQGERFAPDERRNNQLMVAASPRDEVADMHWYRQDFDAFLAGKAADLGAELSDRTQVSGIHREGGVWRIDAARESAELRTGALMLIDATGPRGLLHRLLNLPESEFTTLPRTQALFSHFTGVHRCDSMPDFTTMEAPPYPPDDAALHHLFDGGWMWALRFGNGITSAGISVTERLASELQLSGDRPGAWRSFLSRYPSIEAQFEGSEPLQPFFHSPQLSFRTSAAAGDGWAMLPSAAAFIDPLFSTGIPLTLLGIERLGAILEAGVVGRDMELRRYGETTLWEADATAELVGASLQTLSNLPVFAAFSMFYFTAASYSEMARRFERRRLVTRYLAADREEVRAAMRERIREIPQAVEAADDRFERQVARDVDVLNIAGLAESFKQNWYGVDLQDVVRNAHKLELTPEQVSAVFATASWV